MASNSILLVKNTPATIVERMVKVMESTRGVHQVVVREGAEFDKESREMVSTGWTTLYVRGTDKGVDKATEVAGILASEDQNANHDHAACIEAARNAGVPEEWAHRIETYLSM